MQPQHGVYTKKALHGCAAGGLYIQYNAPTPRVRSRGSRHPTEDRQQDRTGRSWCRDREGGSRSFANHLGGYCFDNRPQHLDSNGNPAIWFVSCTNHGRMLKIMFVRDGADYYLKSAYPSTPKVQQIFNKYNK